MIKVVISTAAQTIRSWVTITVHSQQTLTIISLFYLFEHGVEGSPDDDPADFACTRADLVELCVSQEAPHRIVVNVAVPTCWRATQVRYVIAQILTLTSVCW